MIFLLIENNGEEILLESELHIDETDMKEMEIEYGVKRPKILMRFEGEFTNEDTLCNLNEKIKEGDLVWEINNRKVKVVKILES